MVKERDSWLRFLFIFGQLKELGTALAGFIPDSQRYFDVHHAATDVFESISRRELLLGAANMAALVWLVSEYGL